MSLAAGDPSEVAAVAGAEHHRRRGYLRYAGGKIAGSLGSLAFMLVVNFFLFRVLPGDPARTLGRGRLSTPEQVEEFNETYGLDERHGQQFVTFLKNTLTRRPRLLDPLPQAGLRDPARAALADPAAGRHVDDPRRHVRRLDGDPRRVGRVAAASTGSRPAPR